MSLPVAPMLGGDDGPGDIRRPSLINEPEDFDPMHTANAHDPSITFEEYLYYADITRAEEAAANERYVAARGPTTFMSLLRDRFSTGRQAVQAASPPTDEKQEAVTATGAENANVAEKAHAADGADANGTANGNGELIHGVSAQEWKQASRAIRTAGWGGVFFLITTDILGPFSTP